MLGCGVSYRVAMRASRLNFASDEENPLMKRGKGATNINLHGWTLVELSLIHNKFREFSLN
jgi:hypothetical protein